MSQLELAVESGVSSRHLSCLETGKAMPSREMVLRLAGELRVPLRDQNALLLAAGFAPVFAERPLEGEGLSSIRAAATRLLERHEPLPAVALDRRRDVVLANRAATAMTSGAAPEVIGPPLNIYRLLLHPGGLRPRIVGFEHYAPQLLRRLSREAQGTGDPLLKALFDEVSAYAGVPPISDEQPDDPALTLRLRHGDEVLAFVTTVATFGSPFDITVAELVIESLVPADDATARHFSPT
jgi:transcriptional regulator with XRE-family HTH domain